MIKDRVIQKRIKGKVLAMAMTAVMASFFVPWGVGAADGDTSTTPGGGGTQTPPSSGGALIGDLSQTDYTISGTTCYTKEGKCQGHIIDGADSKTNGIIVEGGVHDIILKNTNIDVRDRKSVV